tara:strand:+ start:126 stop:410 length:285 start_codon:yes stop_codon:yes gene_type:complete
MPYYLERHIKAMSNPDATERPIVDLMEFLSGFRLVHDEGDSKLADDSYSAPPWLAILKAARTLLSTELGRLDGYILDAFILDELKEAGFSESDL